MAWFQPEAAGRRLALRTLIAGATLGGLLASLALLWYAALPVAGIFLGIMFAVFLNGLAERLGPRVRLSHAAAVVVASTLIIGGALVLLGFMGVWIGDQVGDVLERLPKTLNQIRAAIVEQAPWAEPLLAKAGVGGKGAVALPEAARAAGSAVYRIVEGGLTVVLVLFVGIYLALQPEYYLRGLLSLLPPRRRRRAAEVLSELGRTLWLWMVGRLMVMAAVGAANLAALGLLGVPLFPVLALIAGLFTWIPYVGPVLAMLPAALVALTEGPSLALWVVVVQMLIETADGYLLTPLISEYMVDVPAAVSAAVLLVFGYCLGSLGWLIAIPVATAGMVVIRMLYVEDALGERASASPSKVSP